MESAIQRALLKRYSMLCCVGVWAHGLDSPRSPLQCMFDKLDCVNATAAEQVSRTTPLADMSCADGCLPTYDFDTYCDLVCGVIDCGWDGADCDNCPPGFTGPNAWCRRATAQNDVYTTRLCGESCYPWMRGNGYCDAACNFIGKPARLVCTQPQPDGFYYISAVCLHRLLVR